MTGENRPATLFADRIRERMAQEDYLGVLELAPDATQHGLTPGTIAYGYEAFKWALGELLTEPSNLIFNEARLHRLQSALQWADQSPMRGLEIAAALTQLAWINGVAAFVGGRLDEAHVELRRAAGCGPTETPPALYHLFKGHREGFRVIPALFSLYGPDSATKKAVLAALLHSERSKAARGVLAPGEVEILVAREVPGLTIRIGALARLTVFIRTNGDRGIHLSAGLAVRSRHLSLQVRREFEAVARKALQVAEEQLRVPPGRRLEWDIDRLDDTISGPSLGLALVLGIVSAWRRKALPNGTAATGALANGGDVPRIWDLPAKLEAARWEGVRYVLERVRNFFVAG